MRKTTSTLLADLALAWLLVPVSASAGVLDPDCTPEKAAKGAYFTGLSVEKVSQGKGWERIEGLKKLWEK